VYKQAYIHKGQECTRKCMMSKSDSERHSEYHGMYWKVQCSGIGPITRINDVPGEPRGARLTLSLMAMGVTLQLLLLSTALRTRFS
jgi:hypothetical protein